jgi:hypothetical protein
MSCHYPRRVISALSGIAILSSASLLVASLTIGASEPQPVSQARSAGLEENLEALLIAAGTARAPELPVEAEEIVASYDRSAAEIRHKAALEIRERRLQAMRRLKALQDNHTRATQLDEAVAIRDTIRRMLEASFPSIENPGSMHAFANKIGNSYLIRVTGRTTGSVYGTAYFTYDSDVATACVHSGALRSGETGVVVVTMISAGEPHIGSIKNGVRSYDYGTYPASYTVRRWKPSPEEIELGSLKLE